MKKANYIVVVIVAVLLAWSPAYGSEEKYLEDRDGNDWLQSPKPANVFFVHGFLVGVTAMLYRAKIKNKAIDIAAREETGLKRFKFPVEKLELFNITVGQLYDGLETFYKDFRNRNIKIINAIYIVRAEIRGEDPGYIEAQTRWLRKPRREREKLMFKWVKEGLKEPSPMDYRTKNGKFYSLFDYVP
jgi:hypothetical protein